MSGVQTKYMQVQSENADRTILRQLGQLIRDGGVVAFPTETVYGLGGDATNSEAIAKIFSAKGRPADNPLIVHVAAKEQLNEFADASNEIVQKLIDQYWPGPLTIVMPVREGVLSPYVTAGLHTVGVRMPDHPLALQFIREAACPIAAPSANRSGRPSPTQAEHVLEDCKGKIDAILDGGSTGVGLESTVVEVRDSQVVILRPGGITEEQLQTAGYDVFQIETFDLDEAPRSPGMKYVHYAPKGVLTLVHSEQAKDAFDYIQAQANLAKKLGKRTGILTFNSRGAKQYEADCVIDGGEMNNPQRIAQNLYAALRQFDKENIDMIWSETCSEIGLGVAIMNRLKKAAHTQIMLSEIYEN